MQYNAVRELVVLQAVKELGEVTRKELNQHIQKKAEKELENEELERILRRWKKKKVLVTNFVNGQELFSMADVPFIPKCDMSALVPIWDGGDKKQQNEIKKYLSELEGNAKTQGRFTRRGPDIGNYHKFEVEFEALGNIRGGMNSEETGHEDGAQKLVLSRNYRNEIIIRSSVLRGFFRTNMRLANITDSIARDRMGFTDAEVHNGNGKTKTVQEQLNGAKGPVFYEALPPGTKIRFSCTYPLSGSPIIEPEQFRKFLGLLEMPIKGLGSYHGSPVKLTGFKHLGPVWS